MAPLALSSLAVLLAGCVSGSVGTVSTSGPFGATLSLKSVTLARATLELENDAAAPLAYEHWMSQGPEPVPYCRDPRGDIRICASRVYLMPGGEPNVHESYLQPGTSVRFQAVPSGDEQVGMKILSDGKEVFFWLEHWTPDTSLKNARER
jgi:hypothetical protein